MDASTDVNTAVMAAELALRRAMIEADLKALDELLAPDVSYLHSSSVGEDKAQFLKCVETKFYNYETIETRDVRVRTGGELATVNGKMRMTMLYPDGSRLFMNLLFILVWVLDNERWRLCYRQATAITTDP